MRITADEISRYVAELCVTDPNILAVFLMGSCARGEETYFINILGEKEMMSDYEMLIIVNSHSDTNAISDRLSAMRNELISERHSENFDLEWMFKSVNEIKRLDRRFIFFETKYYGKLVYGNIKLLDLFPDINIGNINFSELNTVIIHRLYHVIRSMSSENEHYKKYNIARNSLDFSTAFLPLTGVLVPSYARRTAELGKIFERYKLPEGLVKRQRDYLIMKKDYNAEQYNAYSYDQMLKDFYMDFMLLKELQQRYQNGVLFKTGKRNMISALYRHDIKRIIICLEWGKRLTSLCDKMFDIICTGEIDDFELNSIKSTMQELFHYC